MTAVPDPHGARRAQPDRRAPIADGPKDMRDRSGTDVVDGRIHVPWPLALYFVAVLLPVRFWAGPVMLTSVRVVLLVALLPLLANLLRGRYGRLILPDFLLFAHLAWMLISLLKTTPELAVSQTGSLGAEFLGGYLMGRAFVRSHAHFLGTIRFLTTVILLLLPVAFYEMQTDDSPLLRLFDKLPGVRSYGLVSHEKRMGFDRAQIVFEHPIHWGLFASSMFSLMWVGMSARLSLVVRALLAAGVGIATFSSLSSGALMPVVLQTGLIAWALVTKRVAARWLILSVLAVIAYVVIDLLSNRTPIQVFFTYATFSPHTAYWRGIIFDWGISNIFGSAERGIDPAPLFGIGFDEWVRPWFMYSGSMDNFWLVLGVRHGVPGFLTMAIPYAWMMVRVGRKDLVQGSEVWYLRRAWMFTMLGLALTLATVHIWTAIYSYTFFLLGAGAWFISYEQKRAPAEEPQPSAEASAQGRRYSRFAGASFGTSPAMPRFAGAARKPRHSRPREMGASFRR